ncbi:Rrf2 family transcriptional regulator [Dellaglioa sp. BT-FLS60]
MRISTRYSDAIHILAFIEIYQEAKLTSDLIASSVETSPVVVRRLMGQLREANLITTKQGSAQPRLTKSADEISLLDVYLAVESDQTLFEVDKKTNPECIVGGNIQAILEAQYQQATLAAQVSLNHTSLQEIIDQILVAQKKKLIIGG